MKVRVRLNSCSRGKEEARGLFKMTRLKGRVLRLAQRGAQREEMQGNEMGEEGW